MKKLIAMIAILPVLLALLLAGCTVEDPDHPDSLTGVNGHKYMSLGNSLTAGYMDSGLIMNGQVSSYPRLIAGQMGIDNAVGDSDFSQPYVAFPGIGSSTPDDPANIAGVLYFTGTGMDVVGETPMADVQSILLAATVPTPYHNLGVPGALLIDVMNAYSMGTSYGASVGSPNPFFDFINRASFFGDLDAENGDGPLEVQPTMFGAGIAKGAALATLWIGNNDVLGGATAGTPIVGVTVTAPADFGVQYNTLLQSLAGGLVLRNGFPSTIVVGNIPSITDIPYFMPKAYFEQAMLAYGGWTAGYAEGDDDDGMLVCLPALSYGPANMDDPLPGGYTLTSAEIDIVDGVVTAYNSIISDAVDTINLSYPGTCGLFDANQMMADLPAAQKTHFLFVLPQVGGDIPTAAATTYFSLDGVHPNQKGYGMIANGFLAEINSLLGTEYEDVNLDNLTWDPLYGQDISMPHDAPLVSPRAGQVLENMYR
jgi:hypothetical protein